MSAISNIQTARGWQKNGSGATFCFDNWQAQTKCEPNSTLIISESNRVWTQCSVIPECLERGDAKSAELPLGESYVRQNDFVAIYPEHAPLTYGFQVYYCVKQPVGDVLAVEIWLSVQTSTLESHPQLRLSFEPSDDSSHSSHLNETGSGQFLSNDGRKGLIIHPLDVGDCSWTNFSGEGKSGKPELLAFGGFMEKGVIRRMRLQLVYSHHKMDAALWQQLVQSFANSPLPLTA